MSILQASANKIPEGIRKIIIEKEMVDKATNVAIRNSPMEYLFDVFAEFLDPSGEYQNFECGKCRHHVLESFKKLKPYL